MKTKSLILKLIEYENVDIELFNDFIKTYEKSIKKQINKYQCRSGLEDYKMKKVDYIILLYLYENTKKANYKVELLLLYMYSYYKLDGLDFDKKTFPLKILLDFINNNDNIHSLMFELFNNDIYFTKK